MASIKNQLLQMAARAVIEHWKEFQPTERWHLDHDKLVDNLNMLLRSLGKDKEDPRQIGPI